MKKYLAVLLLTAAVSVAHAQRKNYLMKTIMPSLKYQSLILSADDVGVQEFNRIAKSNMMNIKPIMLSSHLVPARTIIDVADQKKVSESDAYRFLANQLCESCSIEKVVSKELGGTMYTKSGDGAVSVIEFSWLPKLQRWKIVFYPIKDDHTVFLYPEPHPIFN